MKKIGVVTWYEGPNYGTVLQALAMQLFLKKNGYDSYLFNYDVPYVVNKKNKKNLNEIINKLLLRFYMFFYKKELNKKNNDLKNIILNNCQMTKHISCEKDYVEIANQFNTIIYGSDQIWNPDWFHPYYYGYFDSIKSKLISYASSFGVNEIPLEKVGDLKIALTKFDSISVREENGLNIIKGILKKESTLVLDPTFLLDKKDWEELCDDSKTPDSDYILCYMLTDNTNHWKAIKKFAKRKKMKLCIIPYGGFSFLNKKNIVVDTNIGNFLDLIKNAKYVITDSFHCSVFSIIFEKKLILFERHNSSKSNSQNSRLYNLMNMVNIDNFILKYNSKIIYDNYKIDYKTVKEIIEIKKIKSKEYIINAIENR